MLYASDAQEIEGIGSSFRPSRWLHANELALQLLPTFGDLLFLRFENVDWSCGRISQATLASLVNVSLGFLTVSAMESMILVRFTFQRVDSTKLLPLSKLEKVGTRRCMN